MPTIVVYTQPSCPLSQVWVEHLRRQGVPFTQLNIVHDPSAAEALRAMGPLATPTTVVDGECHGGFDRALLDRLTTTIP